MNPWPTRIGRPVETPAQERNRLRGQRSRASTRDSARRLRPLKHRRSVQQRWQRHFKTVLRQMKANQRKYGWKPVLDAETP